MSNAFHQASVGFNYQNMATLGIKILLFFRQTGLTYSQDLWDTPLGVFLVIVAKADDYTCVKKAKINDDLVRHRPGQRLKKFTLTITHKITYNEYLVATFGAIGIFVGFYILVILITCFLCIKDYR